jgi:transposase
MDNLQTRMAEGEIEAVAAREARALCLPPYRPDFNPIEMAFSRVENGLRCRRLLTVDAGYAAQ